MEKKVKIYALVTNDLTNDRRMIRSAIALSEAGYDITLVGRKRRRSKPLKSQIFKQKRIRNWFNKGALFYMEYNIRLLFFLLRKRADIIISVDLDTILPGVLVKYLRRTKLVYDAHEYFTEVPELVHRNFIKSIWERIANWSIPKTDRSYTVGHILAEVLSERYHTDFSTVRNCPEPTNRKMSNSTSPPYLLYQGALNRGRCIELYIRMMHDLPMRLVIAGSGDLDDELRDMVKNEGLEDQISFLGMLDPNELEEVTANAFLGLNLLENEGLSYYYSLANKSLDYIQAGIPSIHSKFPEYEAINDEYDCFILTDVSENDLIEKINLLVSNPDLYRIKRKNCKIAAAELNWQQEKKELLRIYEGLA